MKFILTLLLVITQTLVSAQEYTDEQLNHKLDSLKIDYKESVLSFQEAKKNITDLINILIYNGDYNNDLLSKFVKEINSVQQIYVFSKESFANEKKSEDTKKTIGEALDLKIKAEKYLLLGNYHKKLYDELLAKDNERILTFLRETNYSPSDFKKLTPDQKLKLIEAFERKKLGISEEIISYYNALDINEKSLMMKFTKEWRQTINANDIRFYKRLIDDGIIYRNNTYSDDYFPTEKKGVPLLNYVKTK